MISQGISSKYMVAVQSANNKSVSTSLMKMLVLTLLFWLFVLYTNVLLCLILFYLQKDKLVSYPEDLLVSLLA